MGWSTAQSLRDSSDEGLISFDNALDYHLTLNHYPSLPKCIFPLAKKAIEMYNNGEYDGEIDLTEAGISWRGKTKAPVGACIEAWHLDCFLDEQE